MEIWWYVTSPNQSDPPPSWPPRLHASEWDAWQRNGRGSWEWCDPNVCFNRNCVCLWSLFISCVVVCVSVSLHCCVCTSITSLSLRCKVTIELELHLDKSVKLRASKGPVAHYDVYLCSEPDSRPRVTSGPSPRTANGPVKAKSRVLRWEDDLRPPSPTCSICSICSPIGAPSLPASVIYELQGYRAWTRNSCDPWKWFCECTWCRWKSLIQGNWNSLNVRCGFPKTLQLKRFKCAASWRGAERCFIYEVIHDCKHTALI